MEEKTDLEVELEQLNELLEVEKGRIELAEDYAMLKKNKRFRTIIETVYIKDAKKYLWENIKNFEEEDLLEKGNKREGSIIKMKTELQARLILGRYFDAIIEDGVDAETNIPKIEEAIKEITEEKGK